MSLEAFHGTWKILECNEINNTQTQNSVNTNTSIDGAIFTLKENGEINWELIPESNKSFPLFCCECYEIVHSFFGVTIHFAAVSLGGHIFEFSIDRPVPRDLMLLTFEGWCMISCQQIQTIKQPLDFSFSFLPAFSDGYFSDLQVSSKFLENNSSEFTNDKKFEPSYFVKEFKVHSLILELTDSKLDELTNLPPDVLEISLYYLYTQSLPNTLSKQKAKRCIQYAPPERMQEFVCMCNSYIHRIKLKQKILKLVNEVHDCVELMASAFHENSVTNPSRFCYILKFNLRYAAIAFMKLVELCVLYGEEAPNLQRNERLEILRYAKNRLPIFLTQFVEILRNLKNDFSTVRPLERNDISAHLTPEIETFLGSLSNIMKEARDACNEICIKHHHQSEMENNLDSEINSAENLTDKLFSIFRKRETLKLHNLQQQVAALQLYLTSKKEHFEEMSTVIKIRCVSRNLEQLLEELPVFLLRLEEIMIAFDDRFKWKDFKFCLQLAISQVFETVQHLRKEKQRLQNFFLSLVELVQRDEFLQSLINLKLLDSNTNNHSDNENPTEAEEEDDEDSNVTQHKNPVFSFETEAANTDLNLFDNLCSPKKSKESLLAMNSSRLFNSQNHSDVVFEIAQEDGEKIEIPSHRVILAARCDWFRRALLSGMKESIQKRIVIHDCSFDVFKIFLKYIYSGQIHYVDPSPTENIAGKSTSKYNDLGQDLFVQLLKLADRYEMDTLKLSCEQNLSLHHIEENTVIILLSIADQYNATTLRGSCMEYIALNPGIMAKKEMFEELSPELQMEVYDITMWSKKPNKVFAISEDVLNYRYMLVPDSRSSSSSSSSSPPNFGNFDEMTKPIISSSSSSSKCKSRHKHSHSHSHSKHHSHSHSHKSDRHKKESNSTASVATMEVPQTETDSSSSKSETAAINKSETESVLPNLSEKNASENESNSLTEEEMERCLSKLSDILGEDVSQEELRRIAVVADYDINRAVNFFFNQS